MDYKDITHLVKAYTSEELAHIILRQKEDIVALQDNLLAKEKQLPHLENLLQEELNTPF